MTPLETAAAFLASSVGMRATGSLRDRLSRCVEAEAQRHGLPADQYVERLPVDPEAAQALVAAMTVQESSFFRDPAQFDALTHHVLPNLEAPVTVWSAGCAHGQEPYSIAMLLRELGILDAHVVATDISAAALARARVGSYSANQLRGLSAERRRRWFRRDGAVYAVADSVRDMVTFREHNLAFDDSPLGAGTCQLVLCRNVLIYLDCDGAQAALERIGATLAPGGHLFLGYAETLWPATDTFDLRSLDPAYAYRRRHDSRRASVPKPGGVKAGDACADAEDPRIHDTAGAGRELRAGELAVAAGDVRSAVVAFRRATHLDPLHPVAHLQLALALEATGDAPAARSSFHAARAALAAGSASEAPLELEGYGVGALARLIDAKLAERWSA